MKRKLSSVHWSIVVICFVALVIVTVIGVVTLIQRQNNKIDNFQSCKDAGGAIAESYPEQCFFDGKSFTNPDQSLDNSTEPYIGLAEQAALDEARRNNKIARVVERDGESLAVTMDFMPGRLNLYFRDGKVYKVQVEGEEL
jgi:hypothetical protein